MALYACVTRRRRQLAADRTADLWMESQEIVNPARTTAMLAPGFP